MEPAKIDWNRIESRFVEDSVYEHINAPKWVDFLALQLQQGDSIDDQAWFCTPDCKHPRTAEDFLKTTPPSKLARSANDGGSGSLPLREWNKGDAKLKRRGQPSILSKIDPTTFSGDSENKNPQFSTPPAPNHQHQAKSLKAAIKSSSSSEKKKLMEEEDISQNDELLRLKTKTTSSASARNLFTGRDILNHITDFCNELKKLATRARERENEEKLLSQEAIVDVVKEASSSGSRQILGELEAVEKGRKPLHELGTKKVQGMEKTSAKEKQRKKISRTNDDKAENIPTSVNLENVKQQQHVREERVLQLQIRTNPPSPQCFSAPHPHPHAPMKTPTPSKASRSRLVERGILQEVKQQNKDEAVGGSSTSTSRSSGKLPSSVTTIMDGREAAARALDVFWFLKPCTLAE